MPRNERGSSQPVTKMELGAADCVMRSRSRRTPGCIISSIWQQWCPRSVRVLFAIHRESAPKRCPRLLRISGGVSLRRNYPHNPKDGGSNPPPATKKNKGLRLML